MASIMLPGTATQEKVLAPETFSAGPLYGVTGTMNNRTGINTSATRRTNGPFSLVITPNTPGFFDATSDITITDGNFINSNIKNGVTVLGVTGTLQPSSYASGTVTPTTDGRYVKAIVTGLSFQPKFAIVRYTDPAGMIFIKNGTYYNAFPFYGGNMGTTYNSSQSTAINEFRVLSNGFEMCVEDWQLSGSPGTSSSAWEAWA